MNDNDPAPSTWIPAEAALSRLGVARQTLYAYVSRGLIRVRPSPNDPRRSLYDPNAIDRLLERRRLGRARQAVAQSAIDFGEPVLQSAITQIADGMVWYRGEDAGRLARTATLEDTAALLWSSQRLPRLPVSTYRPFGEGTPLNRALRYLAGLAGPGSWGRDRSALIRDAAFTLRAVAEAVTDRPASLPIHRHLGQAWGTTEDGIDLIRRALVLCADHELNASAFAVRVVASTGASLPYCLLAGLAALSGPLHGGVTERVKAMLAEPRMLSDPGTAVAARIARGDDLSGFGHRLYPDGDPRAEALLDALGPSPHWRGLCAAVMAETGHRPNIDTALAALEQHLMLPDGSAMAIFSVGRTAGWIAHALEQRQDGQLIRPRATYIGPKPVIGD